MNKMKNLIFALIFLLWPLELFAAPFGSVNPPSSSGVVTGNAGDNQSSTQPVDVTFTINSVVIGRLTTTAAQVFSFQIPANFLDGVSHDMFVAAVESGFGPAPLTGGNPLRFNIQVSGGGGQTGAIRTYNFSLSWTDNSSTENGFKIYLQNADGSLTEVGSVAANVTTFSYSATGLEGSQWCFAVKAFITAGSVFSQPANGCGTIPASVPNAVTTLTGSITSAKLVTLNWVDNSDNETGTKIYRNGVEVAQVSANTVSWTETVTGSGGTIYTYRVAPFNAGGTAPLSNTVSLTVPTTGLPSAPTNLGLSVLSTTSIRLNWTDNATNETGYRILRTTQKGSGASKTVALPANTVTYTDTGLTKNTTYCYCVVCSNAAGDSDPALCSCAKTPLK